MEPDHIDGYVARAFEQVRSALLPIRVLSGNTRAK